MANNTSDRDDNGMGLFYVVAIALVILLVFYWMFHAHIVKFLFLIKRFELMVILLWDPGYNTLMNWSNHVLESTVTLKQLKYFGYSVAEALKPVFWIFGVSLMGLLFFFHSSQKYRRKFSMLSLSTLMSKSFQKVFRMNDSQGRPDPAYSIALTPVQYLQKYSLIDNNQLNLNALHTTLMQQLGLSWDKDKQMPIEIYGLFVVFSLYICGQRKQAEALLMCLNTHFSRGSGIKKYMNTRKLNKLIGEEFSQHISYSTLQPILDGHYYTYTVLCELLSQARQGGIVPSSTFLWLKKVNRSLWYALNNVGRKTFFPEGAAIVTHWQFEKAVKKPIATPMLQNVMNALQHEYQLYESLNHDET